MDQARPEVIIITKDLSNLSSVSFQEKHGGWKEADVLKVEYESSTDLLGRFIKHAKERNVYDWINFIYIVYDEKNKAACVLATIDELLICKEH